MGYTKKAKGKKSMLVGEMNTSSKQILALWLQKKERKNLFETKNKAADCNVYHYKTKNSNFKSSVVLAVKNGWSDIIKIFLLFRAKQNRIDHIETRKKNDHLELYIEISSESLLEWAKVRNLLETLSSIDIYQKENQTQLSEYQATFSKQTWFPQSVKDIDKFQHIYMYGSELDSDHPGFTDKCYRQRRRMFAELANLYKYGNPIPYVKYTVEETSTWKIIYTELTKLYKKYACQEFLNNWTELEKNCGYGPHQIPQLQDINDFLKEKTGFQIRPVAGYLSPRDFLSGLAFRVFHCTQYIRHSSDPYYTPEPDCCHEILGHMPMLADTKFAQFSQEIGLASLGSTELDLIKLATCYFFTVEFGLCIEKNEFKIYGAGLLSSAAEMKHVIDGIRNNSICLHKFDIGVAAKTPCIVTDFQKRYFYTKDIEEAKNEMKKLASSVERDGILRYNPYTQSIECIP